MKITIIKPDNYVSIDNKQYSNIDLSSLDSNISAIQWNENFGHIEIIDLKNKKITQNIEIDSIDFISEIINECQIQVIPEITQEELIKNIRNKRNAMLNNCDWTQVLDAPVDQAAWATYRQELRDIPAQVGFPNEIEWPTEP